GQGPNTVIVAAGVLELGAEELLVASLNVEPINLVIERAILDAEIIGIIETAPHEGRAGAYVGIADGKTSAADDMVIVVEEVAALQKVDAVAAAHEAVDEVAIGAGGN